MSSPPPVFTELTVAESRTETPELSHLTISGASPEFLAAYRTPGQYVQIKAGDFKPGFFAIASRPGQNDFDLLIKRGSPLADAIVTTPRGGKIQVSAPAGKGYPMDQARGVNLFVIGVGSGIAPLRSVIQTILADRESFGLVSFIYGARNSTGFPYTAEVDSWKTHEIDVELVCSQPAAGSWNGRVGRVQDALRAKYSTVDARCAAFVCGMKAMVEDVKAAFGNLGLPPERVFQNF